jgi:3'(2'), 5'-bisphosphate nucleotidase
VKPARQPRTITKALSTFSRKLVQTIASRSHQADKIANEIIVAPTAPGVSRRRILAEESIDTSHRLDKARVWMIDPLDGTTGFIDGNGDFAVQIGLNRERSVCARRGLPPANGVFCIAPFVEEAHGLNVLIATAEKANVSDHSENLNDVRLAASRSHRSPRMDKVVQGLGLKEEVRRGSVGIKVGLIVEQQCDLYIHLSPRHKTVGHVSLRRSSCAKRADV